MSDSLHSSNDSMLAAVQAALGTGYTIERELGGGGMSRVFVATETALARRVAVKVLSPELFQGVSAERFAREVALAAQLQDPHIVPVLITGATADGLPWYTMPFIEGESLRARVQRGSVPIDDAVRILRDVAEALEYAHGRGIVHRDIKPENVLLSGRNAVVADFGIAKAMTAARGSMPTGTLTSVGLSLGTPAYMAPEQVGGDVVDHRADLYAWGMMAYELLAGAHPFASRTQAAQLMAAQLSEMPRPLDEVRPGLPPSLGALVMQCLAKSPDERPADAAALLMVMGGTTTDPAMTRANRRTAAVTPKQRPIFIAATLLVLVAAGGAWFALSKRTASTRADDDAAAPSLAVLPFEHQGDSADVYLTEGITDEIRGKLSGVRDLVVIARTSSNSYRDTKKSPQEIAKELGVRYLLTGTVRVVRTGEARRVIVRPELVEITREGQPQSRWGQPFDVGGADVLGLQGEVATQVVTAMEVPGAGGVDRSRITEVATRDPQAYDLYLRGRAATSFGADASPRALQSAIALYEQAVARDSLFLNAWGGLAVVRANLYLNTPSPQLGVAARAAADRALALDPSGAIGAKAIGAYLRAVPRDAKGALAASERAVRADPSDAAAANNLATSLVDLGRIDEALKLWERAIKLDPRRAVIVGNYAIHLQLAGRLREARAATEQLRLLAPLATRTIHFRVNNELYAGDTAAARRILTEALNQVPPDQLIPLILEVGMMWLPAPEVVRTFLAQPPDSSSGFDRTQWFLWRADHAWLAGDSAGQRAWGDSGRRVLARQAADLPTSPQIRGNYALALAYAGRKAAALQEAREVLALVLRQGRDRNSPSYSGFLDFAAMAAVLVGDHEAALGWLEEQRSLSVHFPPAFLRVSPYYAPLRGNPRFQRLTADVPQ